jgi:ankyrin repeat protein
MQDDANMITKYFKKGRDYFNLRNYKHETIFHVAAKFNALASLKELIGRTVFIEELVKKDFKGDTPLHAAAKNGNLEILEFFMSASTKNFLDIHNDFSFTVKESV